MAFLDQEFELIHDNEMEEIIADLPIPLVLENIKEQIEDPLSSKVDNLETILEKYDYIMDNFDDEEQLSLLKNKVSNLLVTVYKMISNKYDMNFNFDEDNMDELRDITQALYSVVILRYTKNITMYLYNFILSNKEELANAFDIENQVANRNNLLMNSKLQDILKDRPEKKNAISIIYNLPYIYKSMYNMTMEPEVEDFLELSGASRTYNGQIILNALETGQACGSFIPEYMKMLSTDYDEIRQEIFNNVKIRLITNLLN